MNQRRRVMESGGKEYPLGIFAYYSDGSIRDYEHADSNAIGVAVITENCRFVMDKIDGNKNKTLVYGGSNINLDSVKVKRTSAEAILDFDGDTVTTALISALAGVTSGGYTGAPAAEYCRTRFDGKGYLGAAGEYYEVSQNATEVNNMLSKIGGDVLDNWYFLTVTPANPGWATDSRVWSVKRDGTTSGSTRTYKEDYVYALMPL